MQHAYSTRLCNAAKSNSKKVLDISTGQIFESVMQAAKQKGIAYSTCKNYLSSKRRNNTRL